MKKNYRSNNFPIGNWIKQTNVITIPESTRTFFKKNTKYRIWTPETIFKFEGYVDNNRFLLKDGGYCCKIYFKYNKETLPISSQFLYLQDFISGKVCFDNELHYYDLIFDNYKEFKDWAVNMHFNSSHKITSMFDNLQDLTLLKKNHQEIFKIITKGSKK